jgi:hypothetical protein
LFVLAALCALALAFTPALARSSARATAKSGMTVTAAKSKASKSKCKVPKLKGKSLAAARRALKKAHCRTGKIKLKQSSKVAKGHVISSKPKAGTKHKAKTKVTLTVSSGKKGGRPPKPRCTVPNVKGQSLAAAEAAVTAAGCTVGKIKQKASSKIPQGEVISSNPKAGTTHKTGKKVSLTVSSGPKGPPKTGCTVPNVKGQSLAAAEAAVIAAGCKVGKIKQKSSSTVPKGNVIDTNPKAGETRQAGSKDSITVSSGKNGYPIPSP